jgi:hypothetical protein
MQRIAFATLCPASWIYFFTFAELSENWYEKNTSVICPVLNSLYLNTGRKLVLSVRHSSFLFWMYIVKIWSFLNDILHNSPQSAQNCQATNQYSTTAIYTHNIIRNHK